MKILITGGNGQLGTEIKKFISDVNEYTFLGKDEFDITDGEYVAEMINSNNFDVIINCAAYTKFDLCPDNEETAYMINAFGPSALADAVSSTNGVLIHISTDYVFGNCEEKEGGLEPFDKANPLSIYGKTKLEGENLIIESDCDYLIFRTSWLYGGDRKNFVKTIFDAINEKDEVKVVDDQFGTPTYVTDLAKFLVNLVENHTIEQLKGFKGLYHFANLGITSWFELASKILEYRKKYDESYRNDCKITPVSTEEFPSNDTRPKFSALSAKCLNLFNYENRSWEKALEECVIKYINENK